MSWANIRTALKTRLQGVTGTGVVHAFQRVFRGTDDQPEFQRLYCVERKVRTYMVTRVKRRRSAVPGESKSRITHSVVILGLLKQDDAAQSDLAFEDLTDAVCNALDGGDRTLGGTCVTHGDVEATIGLGKLVNVDCHLAQIAFEVEEVVS